jgi:Raf kinase inhibitor-like YbhB/YbcL family protein
MALIVEDPDAPGGTFTHWVLFDLPPETKGLGEGIPPEGEVRLAPAGAAARQGKNDFGKLGYGGPCPPRGTHRYVFLLYALDAPLNLKPGATRDQLLRAMKGHILAEGRLMGRYSR